MVASLLRGQFAWRPLYGGQLSRGQFTAVSCPCSLAGDLNTHTTSSKNRTENYGQIYLIRASRSS